jgi:hypothetical protein
MALSVKSVSLDSTFNLGPDRLNLTKSPDFFEVLRPWSSFFCRIRNSAFFTYQSHILTNFTCSDKATLL